MPVIPRFFDLSTRNFKIFLNDLFGKLMGYPQFYIKKREKPRLKSKDFLVCAFFIKVIHNTLKNCVDNLLFIHILRG